MQFRCLSCIDFKLSTGIFNRELTLAAISEGGGVANDMFVRIRTTFNGVHDVSAETYMNNDHLPIAERVRVAVLLVGELSKLKQSAKTILIRCVHLSEDLYLIV